MKIGIVLVATNSYFILGLRFIRRFLHHYKGNAEIKFYLFSDVDQKDYIDSNTVFIKTSHGSWVDATNSKFLNVLNLNSLGLLDVDYLYYFDADTNILKDFDESWFLGDLVGGEHYGNRGSMKDYKNFDRNPKSKAYVPKDTPLPQMYYYGAFFGGKTEKVIEFCTVLHNNQLEDKKINYEPGVNDESYINQYFHYNPPSKVVASENFQFEISDKGGMGETRNVQLDIEAKKASLKENKNRLFDIRKGEIIYNH